MKDDTILIPGNFSEPEFSQEPSSGGSIVPDIPDRQLLESLFDGVYYVDARRRIRFWNKGAERITGYPAEDILGLRCPETPLDHVDDRGCSLCEGVCPLLSVLRSGMPHQKRVYLRHAEGHRVPVDVHATPIFRDGRPVGAIEVFRDASAYQQLEELNRELTDLAYKDPLTGAPSRRWALDRLNLEMERGRRYDSPLCVGLLDVDRFKEINDRYGHRTGDEVLMKLACHIKTRLRSTDIFGRFGGDEFMVGLVLTGISEGVHLIERIVQSLSEIEMDAAPGGFTVSIGLALCARDDTVESCLDKADRALYQAKEKGRNRLMVYDPLSGCEEKPSAPESK